MGFESFTVVLTPCEGSPFLKGQEADSVTHMAEDIQRHWPSVRPDGAEWDEVALYVQPNDVYLFSKTEAGLYQMLLHYGRDGNIGISLRFALCNPRTVYEPYYAMVSWLMRRYQLQCCNVSSVSPNRPAVFCEPGAVAETLTPSMDENRRLWQLDVGTGEEARLRPGEAIPRFILPRCVAA